MGVTESQMHSGRGFWQRGQSTTCSAAIAGRSDTFDMGGLYAPPRQPASATPACVRLPSAEPAPAALKLRPPSAVSWPSVRRGEDRVPVAVIGTGIARKPAAWTL